MRLEDRFVSSTRLVAAAILCASTSACAIPAQSRVPFTDNEYVTLVVRNNNWLDAKIYLLTGGTRRRVGTVTSMSRATVIRLRRSTFSGDRECAIAVELIGSGITYVSPLVWVGWGRTVDLRIQNALSLSTISVW